MNALDKLRLGMELIQEAAEELGAAVKSKPAKVEQEIDIYGDEFLRQLTSMSSEDIAAKMSQFEFDLSMTEAGREMIAKRDKARSSDSTKLRPFAVPRGSSSELKEVR